MHIVIDARFWGPSHTGLGVYTKELVLALSEVDTKNSYTLLVRHEMAKEITLPKNFSLTISDAKPYTFAEQIQLAWQLFSLKPDIVHFPSINVPLLFFGTYVVTVHDVIKHHSRGKESTTLPPLIYWLKYGVYRLSEWIVVARAKHIIVPSQAVATEIAKVYPRSIGKTSVTWEAAVLTTPLVKNQEKGDLDLPPQFAIYTGNAYPHKNLARLVSVWKDVYLKTGVALLISSGRSVFSSKIEKLIGENDAKAYVHFKGYLSDDALRSVYSKATLYVFPSLMEGFGIPALDAMYWDLPVVCSDIPVFREVYGDAAHYFDPNDSVSMAEAITKVASDARLREKLKKAGKNQVSKYSWRKTAENTLAVYNKAL